jgi:hypothetical protein
MLVLWPGSELQTCGLPPSIWVSPHTIFPIGLLRPAMVNKAAKTLKTHSCLRTEVMITFRIFLARVYKALTSQEIGSAGNLRQWVI